MNLHCFIRAALALFILFSFHCSIIVVANGENDNTKSKVISKKSKTQYTGYKSFIKKHDVLYKRKQNKNKYLFTEANMWKLQQANKASVTESSFVSRKKSPTRAHENNKIDKENHSFKTKAKKTTLKNHRNRIVEKEKTSQSGKNSSITTHHIPIASAIESFFSTNPKPTASFTSKKSKSQNSDNIKYIKGSSSKTTHTTRTHDKFPFFHSLFPVPTEHTKDPKNTHHRDLGEIIESRISSLFHPPKKTETDKKKPTKTDPLHFPKPSFLDPLLPHIGHNHSSSNDKKTSNSKKTKTDTETTSTLSKSSTEMTNPITTPTTPLTSTIMSTNLKEATTTSSSGSFITSTHTSTSKSSKTVSYTTRSFSITSSTATPSLVLGVYDCSNDPHTINGKCDYEYFCNSANRRCVALASDGKSCYEDFQCASSYCVSNKCVSHPGYQSRDGSMSGGQIAGATVGSVAGATVVLLGLFGWRRRSQSVNRRIEQLKKSNINVGFYSDYGIAPVKSVRDSSRESKYDFLNQMLGSQPSQQAASSSNNPKPDSTSEMSSIQDPWRTEDQEMTPERRYTFF